MFDGFELLWSGQARVREVYDVLEVWRDWAGDVRGRALDCGHHLAEEVPDEAYAGPRAFFGSLRVAGEEWAVPFPSV